MKRFLQLLVVMAAALTLTASAGADQSYTDPSGDGGVGTDITSLTVRNDANGLIQFQIASASQIVANHAIAIFIDADRNQSTGCQGDEYWMYGGPATGVGFFACSGGSFARTSPLSFSVGAAAANVTEFRINRADIGNVSGFNFVAISISIDGSTIHFWDAAPNAGYYSYDLTTATPPPPTTTTPTTTTAEPALALKLAIGPPQTTPAKAVAGKPFSVSFQVGFWSKPGAIRAFMPVSSGTQAKMVCDPSVAGKVIAHTESLKNGTARLSFVIPKTAKGKQLKVKLTITAANPTKNVIESATKVATFRVG